jgi:hypothetical protein
MTSATERRRLAPVPPGSNDMTDAELLRLIHRADPAAPVRQLAE